MNKFRTERYITQINRNGVWSFRVRYKDYDRIFCESDYDGSAAAYRMAIDFRNSLLVNKFMPTKHTVNDCYEQLEDIYVMRAESKRKYDCIYNKRISKKDTPINDITRADIISDLNACVDTCTTDQIQRVLNMWRKIISLAIAKEYINKDVSLNIKAPISHKIKSIPRNESTDEQTLEELSKALSKRLKCPLEKYQAKYILFTLLWTGMRPCELFALTTEDVDIKNKMISVNKELDANRDKPDTLRPCKNEESHRMIPMSDKLVDLLKDYEPNCDIFFGIKDKHYKVNDIGNRYHQIAKKIGIDFHFYQCRHTFITNLYRKGVDIKTIQRIVGQNIDATTYGYIIDDNQLIRNAVNLI